MSIRPKGKWGRVSLASLAEFRNGVNFSKENFGTGMKVIGVSDFQDNVRASFGGLDEINPEGVVRKEHLLQHGDILFVRSNGNRELIGRSMYVENILGPVTHSAFSIRLRFTAKECHPQFYAYLFRGQLVRQALSLFGGGTNISNLNQDILGRLEVPVPPMQVQKRIAAILSAYDDLIENNTRRIKILEQMAQMLYREWFVNFRFPGHEEAERLNSEVGQTPNGWHIRKVRDVILRLAAGRVYQQTDITANGPIPVIDQSKDELLGFHCNVPDHLATIKNPIAIFGDHTCKMRLMLRPFSIGPNVVPFVSKAELPMAFVFFLVRALVSTSEYKRHWTDLANKTVVIPGYDLTAKFAHLVTPILVAIENMAQISFNLRKTRDLLLPKLVSGEISVKQLESEAIAQNA